MNKKEITNEPTISINNVGETKNTKKAGQEDLSSFEVYEQDIKRVKTDELKSVLEKIAKKRAQNYALSVVGKTTKTEIEAINASISDKKKNRTLFELFTSPLVKNRQVWIPFCIDAILDTDNCKKLDMTQSEVLRCTSSSYIDTFAHKFDVNLYRGQGTRGFKPISQRSAEEITRVLSQDQKAELIKQLLAEQKVIED